MKNTDSNQNRNKLKKRAKSGTLAWLLIFSMLVPSLGWADGSHALMPADILTPADALQPMEEPSADGPQLMEDEPAAEELQPMEEAPSADALLPMDAATDLADVIADIGAAQITFAAGDSLDNGVSHDFTVPVGVGPNGSTYLWSESSEYLSINQATGLVTVTRPTSGPAWGVFVTFALTATKNASSDIGVYEIRIPLNTEPAIVFADPVLSSRLAALYDTNGDHQLSQTEADLITSITSEMLYQPTPQTVTDLSGLEACHNLETLDLSFYESMGHFTESLVTSLAPLSGLTKLKTLKVGTSAAALDDLANLSTLTTLELEGTGASTDIDAVYGLFGLQNLALKRMGITNIVKFYDMKDQLSSLNLSLNPINNSATADCIHLSKKDFTIGATSFEVWIPSNGEPTVVFADSALSIGLTSLYDTNDDDILSQSEVDAITSISSSDIFLPQHHTITDLSGLEACHNLETLDLSYYDSMGFSTESSVPSLAPLSNLTKLKTLKVGTVSASLDALASLTTLTTLELEGNGSSTDLDALFGMTGLKNLSLKRMGITNIAKFYDLKDQLLSLSFPLNTINSSATAGCIHLVEKDFTVGANSFAVWIPQAEASPDLLAVLADLSTASPTYGEGDSATHISAPVALPLTGSNGTTITWKSSSTGLLIDPVTGATLIDRPSDADLPFTLTARVSKNGISREKPISVILKKLTELDQEVFFEDPVIRGYLLSHYDDNQDHKLTKAEVLDVTALSSSGFYQPSGTQEVTSLAGLEECENLRVLDLSYFSVGMHDVRSNITNLTPIADLTKLYNLKFDGVVTDLSDLQNLTNLEYLAIGGNGTKCNISTIFSLTKLKQLSLNLIALDSVEGFENLYQLSLLHLYGNKIKNIEPISFLAYQLTSLELRGNPINNAQTIGCYHKIQSDFVVNQQIYQVWVEGEEAIDPELEEVVTFTDEVLREGMIAAFDDDGSGQIEKREARRILRLSTSQLGGLGEVIRDITGLEELTNLAELDLTEFELLYGLPPIEVHVTDLSPLAGLTKLTSLKIEGSFETLSPLARLTQLKRLEIYGDGQKDTSINAVYQLTNLESITLDGLRIKRTDGFVNFQNLTELSLTNNQINDIEPISEIASRLTSLYLYGNPINSSTTPGCTHKAEKDFTVRGTGYQVWKNNAQTLSDLEEAANALTTDDLLFALGDDEDNITASFNAPIIFLFGTTISWSGNHAALSINNQTGVVTVTRPAMLATATLTATLQKDGATLEKRFPIQLSGYLDDALIDAARALTIADFLFTAGDAADRVTANFVVPVASINDTTVTWSEDSSYLSVNPITGTATVTRLANSEIVSLNASIQKEGFSTGKQFLLTLYGTNDEALNIASANLTEASLQYAAGDSMLSVTQSFTLPLSAANGVTITWVSDSGDVQINASTGRATFAKVLVDHTETFTAILHKNERTLTEKISLRFVAVVTNDSEAVQSDLAGITPVYATGNTADYVTKSFTVPTAGTHGSSISWSENSKYLSIDASNGLVSVTLPEEAGYHRVTYTATARKGMASAQKTFEILIFSRTSSDEEVEIADPDLREQLLEQYDANNNGKLSKFELSVVTSLSASMLFEPYENKSITSLSGLEYMENLETIDFQYYEISQPPGSVSVDVPSLAPLAELEKLRVLKVTGHFGSLDDLSALTNLEELSVVSENASAMSIEPLVNLKKLKDIGLIGMKLATTEGFDAFPNLETLMLHNNGIRNIEPLYEIHGQLESLSIHNNPLYNSLSVGCTHKESKDFYVNNTKFEVWAPGEGENLAYLYEAVAFSDPNIQEEMLAAFDSNNNGTLERREVLEITTLETAQLVDWGETISDLGGFEELKNLSSFVIGDAELFPGMPPIDVALTDLGPLSGLNNLQTLYVEGTFETLAPLARLQNLKSLSVYGDYTKKTNISAIFGLSNLESLSLYNLKISSVVGISALTKLDHLNLSQNLIRDIEPISEISPRLKYLSLDLNPLNNASTVGVYHKVEKDFTVGSKTYEVWKEANPVRDSLLEARNLLSESAFTYHGVGDSKTNVNANFTVPINYLYDTTITWYHGSEYLQIDPFGLVTVSRPAQDTVVQLTAIVKKGGLESVKILEVTLKKRSGGSNGGNQQTTAPIHTGGAVTPIVITDGVTTPGLPVAPGENGVLRPNFIAPIEGDQMGQQIASMDMGGTLSVQLLSDAPVIRGEISADLFATMQERDALFEIKTDQVEYRLPTNEIDLDAIAARMGVAKEDITISIEISESTPETIEFVRNLEEDGKFKMILEPIEFEIRCTSEGQEEIVDRFSSYVQRKIQIPAGIDPLSVTTAVVVSANGELTTVPTRIVVENGVAYAVINSMSNSTYALISVSKTFTDTENEDVLLLASKLIISGYADGSFQPEKEITRAEFVAMLSKALGLAASEASSFTDVSASHWAKAAIDAAVEYELVHGYGNGTFAPNALITNQEARILMNQALLLAGKESGEASTMTGTVTREEMAELIVEMMKQAELI